jgi:hypothetical protein
MAIIGAMLTQVIRMKLDYPMRLGWLAALGLVLGIGWVGQAADSTKAVKSKSPPPKQNTVTVNNETFVVPEDPQRGNANELLLKKFDLNGDGKIDESEIAAAQARLGTNKPPTLTKANDGRRLTAKDLYEGGDPAKHRAVNKVTSDDLLKQYDLNHDGKLDASEVEQLKRDLEKGGTHQAQPLRSDKPLPPPAKPKPVAKEPIR